MNISFLLNILWAINDRTYQELFSVSLVELLYDESLNTVCTIWLNLCFIISLIQVTVLSTLVFWSIECSVTGIEPSADLSFHLSSEVWMDWHSFVALHGSRRTYPADLCCLTFNLEPSLGQTFYLSITKYVKNFYQSHLPQLYTVLIHSVLGPYCA